ncbi:MAG TPA: tRNA pseudouridine(55) synthase TruB [Acidobacteriaceae bacterium]
MNGLLLVDKPGGMTSHDVVARVRRLIGEKSVGHLGTLDPMATGLLPLLLGSYTRLARFFGALEKSYTGSIRFGFATDTWDADGAQVGEAVDPLLTLDQLRDAAAGFVGESEQMPPAYSAKKIGGKPAYAIARSGETPRLKAARVTIDEFSIGELAGSTACFAMRISSGGYVRSVAHELGQQMGSGAHLCSLRRVAAGEFKVEDAMTLEALREVVEAGKLGEFLPHPRTLLAELPAVTADAGTLVRLRNGMQVNLPEFSRAEQVRIFAGQAELAAIGRRVAGTLFQPLVVLSERPTS